jgi:hypothetical protein
MEDSVLKVLLFSATALTALLCGVSLDQSIKQLPARRVIGVKIFSEYAKAADLRTGVPWYAALGISSALLSIIAAVWAVCYHLHAAYTVPLVAAGVFAVCHTICTTQAAPTYHRQKKISDEQELEKLFNKFERIQTFRSAFIVLNFACFLVCLWMLI